MSYIKYFILICFLFCTAWGNTTDLASGAYSEMKMLLEKTIFQVDVLNITFHFGTETQKKIQSLHEGKKQSEYLADEIVQVIYKTPRTTITVQYVRDIDYKTYMSEVKISLECALKSGVLDKPQHQEVRSKLDEWYGRLKDRGLKDGDKFIYTIDKDTIQTTFIPIHESPVVNPRLESAGVYILSLLGSYLAPCSEFRMPLLKSLKNE